MKEPFVFEYTYRSLDWFESKRIIIKENDYLYFRIERRFGPSWWLIGKKVHENPYRWEEVQIGEIREDDLKRFIEWSKHEWGSSIVEVTSISGDFNIINEIIKITKD